MAVSPFVRRGCPSGLWVAFALVACGPVVDGPAGPSGGGTGGGGTDADDRGPDEGNDDESACVDDPAATPFATRVASFALGDGAGFGQDAFPDVVLGPPRGSLDVLSLGLGGEIVLELGRPAIDDDGPDLLVFENAFSGFAEPGEVAVSADGHTFFAFPCAAAGQTTSDDSGCAGVTATATLDDDDGYTDPSRAGGDGFDLADVGLACARFVRLRDASTGPPAVGGSTGFDLDAVARVVR